MSPKQNDPTPGAVTGPRPLRLTVAALIAALQGAALAAGGLYLLAMPLVGHPVSLREAEMGGVTVLAIAALPLAAAYGLWRARRWSRGPVVIVELIALPVAWTMAHGGGGMITAAVTLLIIALAELALLIHPATSEALGVSR